MGDDGSSALLLRNIIVRMVFVIEYTLGHMHVVVSQCYGHNAHQLDFFSFL